MRPRRPSWSSAAASWWTPPASGGPTSGWPTAGWWRWPGPSTSRRGPRSSTPGAAWWHPDWSTCTPTSASPGAKRPRPSRPAHGPPPSVASPPSWPCPTPTRRSTRPSRCATSTPWPRGPWPRSPWPGAITVGRAGERLAPMAELAALGVRLFTDDGDGVQSAGLMRRALQYATGLGVILGQHCEDRSLACRGTMHEGAWSSRLGLPGMPAEAEEVMVARGHRPGPGDGRAGPLPPPLDGRFGRPGPPGPGGRRAGDRRGRPAPLHPHRRVHVRLRPGVQGQSAAATPGRRRRRQGGAGRRDGRRHRHRPRPARPRAEGPALRPGSARDARACRRPWPWPSTELDLPLERILALLSWQPAAHRRPRPGATAGPRAARSLPGRSPTCV